MQENKVNFVFGAEKTCTIGSNVRFGKNVTIYANNMIVGDCEIADGVVLFPNNIIKNSKIGKSSIVTSSVIEDSRVCECVKVGPFAHLRPNSIVKNNAKIGNFVELKNSTIGEGSKVSHLTYVGDAEIGKNVNVGCGVVFVNYNGKTKLRSIVGDNSFIGSSVNIIAPVTVGEGSFVCAGTTLDRNVDAGSFAIGRSRVQIKQGRAKNYLKKE